MRFAHNFLIKTNFFQVIQNLLISHLEFRTEESIDVHPFVFQRNLTTVVVPLGEKLQQVKDDYLQVKKIIYILYSLFKLYLDFRQSHPDFG